MNKKIDDLEKLSSNQLLIRNNHMKFDLETFMNHNSESEAAVLLVTPSQFILTDCFIESSYEQGYYTHEDTMRVIYSSISIELDKIKNNKSTLENLIIKDGNIFMLLCNEFEIFSIIGIPKVISKSQYNFLVTFNNELKKIYQNNKDYFDYHPMKFTTYYDNNACYDTLNNIDGILHNLKKNIGYIQEREEILLGDRIKDIDIDIVQKNTNLSIKRKILKK